MKTLAEPQFATESVQAALFRAKTLIEDHDYEAASLIYTRLLDGSLSAALRGEVLTNLGVALCMLGRGLQGPHALARLDEARDRLLAAIALRPRSQAPDAWATTRANLALVHIARYEATGRSDELLSAHLALDGTEHALRSSDTPALLDWITAIRDQLLELQERRSKRR